MSDTCNAKELASKRLAVSSKKLYMQSRIGGGIKGMLHFLLRPRQPLTRDKFMLQLFYVLKDVAAVDEPM
jgi:hypothetical protein